MQVWRRSHPNTRSPQHGLLPRALTVLPNSTEVSPRPISLILQFSFIHLQNGLLTPVYKVAVRQIWQTQVPLGVRKQDRYNTREGGELWSNQRENATPPPFPTKCSFIHLKTNIKFQWKAIEFGFGLGVTFFNSVGNMTEYLRGSLKSVYLYNGWCLQLIF